MAAWNVLIICLTREPATFKNAPETVCTTGALGTHPVPTAWIALLLVVVVLNSAIFRLWCNPMQWDVSVLHPLKLNLATPSAAL